VPAASGSLNVTLMGAAPLASCSSLAGDTDRTRSGATGLVDAGDLLLAWWPAVALPLEADWPLVTNQKQLPICLMNKPPG
jgi:hypothetical protein